MTIIIPNPKVWKAKKNQSMCGTDALVPLIYEDVAWKNILADYWRRYGRSALTGAGAVTLAGVGLGEMANAGPEIMQYSWTLPLVGAALGTGYKWLTDRGE